MTAAIPTRAKLMAQHYYRVEARTRRFPRTWQSAPGRIPASLDPDWALGAFPLSPIHHALRTDVTAHALLALN
jgi:hypothetical protein